MKYSVQTKTVETFTVGIAGDRIALSLPFSGGRAFLRDYLCEAPAELSVVLTPEDIAAERARAEALQDAVPAGAVEELALLRALCSALLPRGVLLLHASAVAVDGCGYAFAAPSGTGKSTHARLWRALLGERCIPVNDDKPFIRAGENGVTVYGSPWDGKHHLSRNIGVPLKAFCLLERAEENRVEPISFSEGFEALFRQTESPETREGMARKLEILDAFRSVSFFRLGCNMSPDAAVQATQELLRER